MTETIFHITSLESWRAAVDQGAYYPDSLSAEGFIHCSKPAQVILVANSFYAGQHGLVLLVIDPARLTAGLKWEPPAELAPVHAHAGELFPHIYGPLNLEAVGKVIPFEPGPDGTFDLPAEL